MTRVVQKIQKPRRNIPKTVTAGELRLHPHGLRPTRLGGVLLPEPLSICSCSPLFGLLNSPVEATRSPPVSGPFTFGVAENESGSGVHQRLGETGRISHAVKGLLATEDEKTQWGHFLFSKHTLYFWCNLSSTESMQQEYVMNLPFGFCALATFANRSTTLFFFRCVLILVRTFRSSQ